jgi:hypothetical protein
MHLQTPPALRISVDDGRWTIELSFRYCGNFSGDFVLKKVYWSRKSTHGHEFELIFAVLFVVMAKNERGRILTIISIIQEVLIIFLLLLSSSQKRIFSSAGEIERKLNFR